MGKLVVLAMQSHRVLTCACDCVAKNACLPLPGEIKPPQTTQNCRNDGKSSAAISGTDLTLRVRYFPRQPRTPILPRRPPASRSTSYPAGRTRWHLDGDGATDDDGDGDGATDNDDDNDDNGNDCDGAAAGNDIIDDDVNDDDINDVDDHNLPPRIGKRNDCFDETKPEEEGTVADSVAICTTIKQIMGRGGGRWQRIR